MLWTLVAIICIVALYFFAVKCRRPEVHWLTKWKYAHRGLHDRNAPENTMPAFSAACAHGFGIELDVHLSRDNQVVVFHDDDLQRLGGRHGKPEDLTAAEMGSLSILGTSFGAPTLKEVLQMVAGRVPLLIEIKSTGFAGRLEEETWRLLKEYKGLYAMQSFSPFSMRWFKKHVPGVLRGQLSFSFHGLVTHVPKILLFLVRHLLTDFLCRPNFISYGKETIDTPVVQFLRKRGIPILAWTIDTPNQAQKVAPSSDTIIFQNYIPTGGKEISPAREE